MTKKYFLIILFIISIMSPFCKKESNSSVINNADKGGANPVDVLVERNVIKGHNEPDTPDAHDKVGYNRYYTRNSSNREISVLILVSGYSVGSGWFDRLARMIVMKSGMEVFTINRRETILEKRDELDRDINAFIKNRSARKSLIKRMQRMENYSRADKNFIKYWGFDVQINDIKAVVEAAMNRSRNLFLGGWSDGVEYVMAYANYRFKTGFGSKDLKGLVFLDENPEWGRLSGNNRLLDKKIERQKNLIKNNQVYMKSYPSLAIHILAMELAARYPDTASPLTETFRLPDDIRKRGITNRALIGWLYDLDIEGFSRKKRGGWALLFRSGSFQLDDKISLSKSELSEKSRVNLKRNGYLPIKWVKGGKSDIDYIAKSGRSSGSLWELFYPRKILLDYFKLGRCDFNCPKMKVYLNRENRLPVFYALSGTNNIGRGTPSGLKWYMARSGIKLENVKIMRLYDYAHADIFFAGDAPGRLYNPLYKWLMKNSSYHELNKN